MSQSSADGFHILPKDRNAKEEQSIAADDLFSALRVYLKYAERITASHTPLARVAKYASAILQLSAPAMPQTVEQIEHSVHVGNLGAQFPPLRLRHLLPTLESCDAGPEAVEQMIDFDQPKAAALRKAEDGYGLNPVGAIPAFTSNAWRTRQESNSFPIADRGRVYAALRCEFANRHEKPLDLKSTSSVTVEA